MEFFKRKSSKKKKENKKQDQKSNESRAKNNDDATGISKANRVVDQPRSSLNTTDTRNTSHGKQGQPNKAKPTDAHLTSSSAIKDPNDKINDADWEKMYPSLPRAENETAKSLTTFQSSSQAGATSTSTSIEPHQGKILHGNQRARTNAGHDALLNQLCQMNLQDEISGLQAIDNQSLQNEVRIETPPQVMEKQEKKDGERERQQEEQQNQEEQDRQEEVATGERERQDSQSERERQDEREGESQREEIHQGEIDQEVEENEVHAPVQEEAEKLAAEPSVSSLLENENKLVETLGHMLLPYHSLIKNWESLSHELGASPALRTQLKRQTNHSQTRELFETLSAVKKDLKVQKLIDVVGDLRRKDVVELLRTKIPENQRQSNVSDKVMTDDELMETLETLLDKESKIVKNWYHVGLKLGLNKATLQEIKDGNFGNNIGGFFEYVYTRFPELTVEMFKTYMRNIDRNDVVEELSGVPEGPLAEKIPLHGDKMLSLCYMLSKNSCGTVKDWKHLAMELDIGYHEYKIYEKEVQEDPTKLLLEWALIDKPNMTITELCEHLKNIKRYDVIYEVEKYYGHSFIET